MVIPHQAVEILLKDASARDRPTARRHLLLSILAQERFLTRDQLIVRVEGSLGKGCFGEAAWDDTFFRDMQVVRQAFKSAGLHLAYSRRARHAGYYLRGHPTLGEELQTILEGSIAEVDRAQIGLLKQLSFRQRFLQGYSISRLAIQVVAHRKRSRNPQLSDAEARRMAVKEGYALDLRNT